MKKQKKIILVTGASTGIGYRIALELAKDGNTVYAGARKPEDIERLSRFENVTGIELDITKPEQISAAVNFISQKENCVDVLINNAGITGWGAVVDRDMEYIRKVMETNFFGHVAMIKAFYPLIKKSVSEPIIINISSQAGNYVMPFWSAYHSSKWAIEAFSHSLRRELRVYEIRVAIVQPGAIESEAFTKDIDAFEQYKCNNNSDFVKYASPLLGAAFHRDPISKAKSPMLVVRDIRHAIYHRKNKIYYQPGRRLIPDFILAKLPYRMVDFILSKLVR